MELRDPLWTLEVKWPLLSEHRRLFRKPPWAGPACTWYWVLCKLSLGRTKDEECMLTFHLLLAKFFLICSLTDWWIFLSRAVSPAILGWGYMQVCL